MKKLLFLLIMTVSAMMTLAARPAVTGPEYSIQAIRYASAEDEVAGLVMGAPKGEKINIAMVVWLIRGGGHNILFDSGYHRETFLKYFPSTKYMRPDEAVKLAGVQPEEITDIVISHSHWDHLGGIDLFPKATVWIQKEEYRYYTGDAWQHGGNHGGIDPEDVQALVKLNTEGRVHLVDGDNVEIFPGIRAYTGARHTFASQYIRVEGNPTFVLASDNCYLYRNMAEHKASATWPAPPIELFLATTCCNSRNFPRRAASPRSNRQAPFWPLTRQNVKRASGFQKPAQRGLAKCKCYR